MSKFSSEGRGIQDPRSSTFIANLDELESGQKAKKRPMQLNAQTCVLRLDELTEADQGVDGLPVEAAPQPMQVASRMIVFFGPKGGTGTTSTAVNVGGALARFQRNTVLVDMDLQLGAVPVCLDMKPERSIAELVLESVSNNGGPLQSGLDKHQSGLHMVAQSDRMEELAEITSARLPGFFEALGQSFEYVLVDGLRDFNDHAVTVMDLAHKVVLVCTQDVPSVRASARSLRLFRRLGYGPDRIKVVLNRYQKKADVTLEAVHNALGQPVDAVIRNDFRMMILALNHGVMVSDVKPGCGLAKDLDALAALLADENEAERRGGFFSKLFGRG
ncbi:AAA family ATPase [Myxococcota bacterium]|nr:AAA family ATPase [Myxococcota bacterium]MBU1432937.1 AAA family ATPase [Myxococcota bacterium]MBU1896239.1 AAA family ATPase [Myxococcota bacterium]